ncbi:MAG: tyrosine-type recombinase/integrase [Gammaproteobacteria bacterium]
MDKELTVLNEGIILRNEKQSITVPFSNPYITAATSENTRRAYRADIQHFEKWGGELPASTETILIYLQAFAKELNPRTLARRLTALKNWHIYQGLPDPTQHPSVSKTLAGIMRTHGKPKDKAPPLLPEHLIKIVAYLNTENRLRASRDSALLQLAFFGAFRRSEIVAICYEHVDWKDQGIDILIPHSKTDQTHEGRYCAIPYGNEQLCPVRALKQWIEQSKITSGPLFRRIHLEGHLNGAPLAPLSVSNILVKRARDAEIPQAENFSSHSLRRGLATSASRDGAALSAIMRQGRWKNVNTVMEYIEAAQRFEENAAASVLKKIQDN